jgi:F-type H+-transporting ATPase subunit b
MKMGNKGILIITFLFPIVAMASGTEHHEVSMNDSDFFYRILNFGIFAMLIYYLVANPIKGFFKNRSADIASQIDEIKARVQESKNKEKLAQERLAKSQEKAKEIIADSHSEAKILVDNIAKKNNELLNSMERHLEEKMEIEKKRMIKATIYELLENGIESSDIAVDNSRVISLISKRVA